MRVKLKLMKAGSLENLAAQLERIRELGMEPVLGNGVGRLDATELFLKPQPGPALRAAQRVLERAAARRLRAGCCVRV